MILLGFFALLDIVTTSIGLAQGGPIYEKNGVGRTLWIAGGASVIAGFGSAFAALGLLLPFSVAILLGVAAMFLGFRRAVRTVAA